MPAPAKSKALDPDEVVEFYIEKMQFFITPTIKFYENKYIYLCSRFL